MKNMKIDANGTEIRVMGDIVNEDAYISLTDIAKYKNPDNAFIVVANWMRNHSTISFLGLWEQIHNPNFKPIEFDRFKIGIVNLFPQAQKRNRGMVTHPVCHHDKSIIRIFIFGNVSQRNISVLINNIAHYSDFCSISVYFHVFHIINFSFLTVFSNSKNLLFISNNLFRNFLNYFRTDRSCICYINIT